MGNLNINSLRNKFESIKSIISPNSDTFLVSETKLDEPFLNNKFSMSVYRMFRQDRNCFGGPYPSLQILGKTQTGVFPISGFLFNPL